MRPDKLPSNTLVDVYSMITFIYLESLAGRLQYMTIVGFMLLIQGKAIKLLVPLEAGNIVDVIRSKDGELPRIPWLRINLLNLFRLFRR